MSDDEPAGIEMVQATSSSLALAPTETKDADGRLTAPGPTMRQLSLSTRRRQSGVEVSSKDGLREDSEFEDDEDAFENLVSDHHVLLMDDLPWYIIRPTSTVKLVWDFFILLLLVVLIMYLPFQLAFTDYERTVWDWLLDAMFMADIIVNSVTATRSESGQLVTSIPGIVSVYARSGALLFDIVAAFPIDYFVETNAASFTSLGKLSKVVKLSRALKLVKVNKMADLVSEVGVLLMGRESKTLLLTDLDASIMFSESRHGSKYRLCKVFCAVILLAHVSGCTWYFFGSIDDKDENSWIVRVWNETDEVANNAGWKRYLVSVYAMLTILTTVGFGDITPRTGEEIIYVICMMLLGTAFFSFLTASLVGLITVQDKADERFHQNMQLLLYYMRQRSEFVSPSLRAAVISRMAAQWKRSFRVATEEDVKRVLLTVPVELRTKLAEEVHGGLALISPLLSVLKDEMLFFVRLSEKLVSRVLAESEHLFARGYDIDAVCWISEGYIDALVTPRVLANVIPAVESYDVGMCCGDLALLDGSHRVSRLIYRARTPTSVWGIAVDSYRQLLVEYGYLSIATVVAKEKLRSHTVGEKAYRKSLRKANALPQVRRLSGILSEQDLKRKTELHTDVEERLVKSADLDRWDRGLGVAKPRPKGSPAPERFHWLGGFKRGGKKSKVAKQAQDDSSVPVHAPPPDRAAPVARTGTGTAKPPRVVAKDDMFVDAAPVRSAVAADDTNAPVGLPSSVPSGGAQRASWMDRLYGLTHLRGSGSSKKPLAGVEPQGQPAGDEAEEKEAPQRRSAMFHERINGLVQSYFNSDFPVVPPFEQPHAVPPAATPVAPASDAKHSVDATLDARLSNMERILQTLVQRADGVAINNRRSGVRLASGSTPSGSAPTPRAAHVHHEQ